jgi:hypothetical protein
MKLNLLYSVLITGISSVFILFIFENLSSTGSISSQQINLTGNKLNYVTEYNLNGDILECTVVDKSNTPFVWRNSGIDTIGLIKFRMYQGKIGIWKPNPTNKNLINTDSSELNKIYQKFKLNKLSINGELDKLIPKYQPPTQKNSTTNTSSNGNKGVANSVNKTQTSTKQSSKASMGTTTKNADDL